jgi:hypothetical protein
MNDTAARRGHLRLLKFFKSYNGNHQQQQQQTEEAKVSNHPNPPFRPTIVKDVAHIGHLHVLKYLLKILPPNYTKGIRLKDLNFRFDPSAAHNNLVDVITYLNNIGYDEAFTDDFDILFAVKKGCLEAIKYLTAHRPSSRCTTAAMNTAAKMGRLDIVQYLHENRSEGCSGDAGWLAAQRGHWDVLKYLWEIRKEDPSSDSIQPIRLRNLILPYNQRQGTLATFVDIIAYLNGIGHEMIFDDESDIHFAVQEGCLEAIRYLTAHRPSSRCTTATMDTAAEMGRLDIVQYLHENRSEGCSSETLNLAGYYGHLHVVKYLQEIGNEEGRRCGSHS